MTMKNMAGSSLLTTLALLAMALWQHSTLRRSVLPVSFGGVDNDDDNEGPVHPPRPTSRIAVEYALRHHNLDMLLGVYRDYVKKLEELEDEIREDDSESSVRSDSTFSEADGDVYTDGLLLQLQMKVQADGTRGCFWVASATNFWFWECWASRVHDGQNPTGGRRRHSSRGEQRLGPLTNREQTCGNRCHDCRLIASFDGCRTHSTTTSFSSVVHTARVVTPSTGIKIWQVITYFIELMSNTYHSYS